MVVDHFPTLCRAVEEEGDAPVGDERFGSVVGFAFEVEAAEGVRAVVEDVDRAIFEAHLGDPVDGNHGDEVAVVALDLLPAPDRLGNLLGD